MLTRDVRFEGFTTEDWTRLLDIVRGPKPTEVPVAGEEDSLQGGVIALVTGNRLEKLIGTRLGRLETSSSSWPEPLEALAKRYSARWAAQMEVSALSELMDRFAERLRPEQELMGQALLFLSVMKELSEEKLITIWPRGWLRRLIPSERVALKLIDSFCPEGQVALFGAFEDGHLATSIAARRKPQGFDFILGPDELRQEMGMTSRDWTRDYRHLIRAVEFRLGPLGLGCFGEVATFEKLFTKPIPGQWAASVAARDIILSPTAPGMVLPFASDLSWIAVKAIRELADRVGTTTWLSAETPWGPTWERVREATSGEKELESILGFDPLNLLKQLFSRSNDDPS